MLNKKTLLRDDALLLLTAIIWGFAFVAQREGMKYIGPFLFNGIRFALGSLSLLPLYFFLKQKESSRETIKEKVSAKENENTTTTTKIKEKGLTSLLDKLPLWFGPLIAGIVLFSGASLQQVGIITTTAGNAGFITGLYVVLVPFLGIFAGKKSSIFIWIGAVLALVGLYFLSITSDFKIATGDIYVLIGAFFWAFHILIISHYAPKINVILLAMGQFAVCSILSLMVAIFTEPIILSLIIDAVIPICYGAFFSIGIAYTLQIFAQKTAHPAHASIILSMEALFAGLGGILFLQESLTVRIGVGSVLMLFGMVISQLELPKKN